MYFNVKRKGENGVSTTPIDWIKQYECTHVAMEKGTIA